MKNYCVVCNKPIRTFAVWAYCQKGITFSNCKSPNLQKEDI